jgi:hypothetical protein
MQSEYWINNQTPIENLGGDLRSLITICRTNIEIEPHVLEDEKKPHVLEDEKKPHVLEDNKNQQLLLDLAGQNEWSYVGEILQLYKNHRPDVLSNVTNCTVSNDAGFNEYTLLMYIAHYCRVLDNQKYLTDAADAADAIKYGLPIIKELVNKYKADIDQKRCIRIMIDVKEKGIRFPGNSVKVAGSALDVYTFGNKNPQQQIINILTPNLIFGGKKNIIRRKKNRTIKKTKKLKKSHKPKRGKKSKKNKKK